jgi:lysophospholipase L1-like esterase
VWGDWLFNELNLHHMNNPTPHSPKFKPGIPMIKKIFFIFAVASMAYLSTNAHASKHWVTSWIGSVQGPYPVGNPSAQPHMEFAIPTPAQGIQDQTMRMIIRPDIWGDKARIRLSNAYGDRAVTFDHVYIGLQLGSAEIVKGTNQSIHFNGKDSITLEAGSSAWSDAVSLPFVKPHQLSLLAGRKLAVSFHVPSTSGPMTWHAKALQTSYLSGPNSGVFSSDEHEAAFAYATSSWFFLDALDMMVSSNTRAIVCFGDSITDGTASVMNGDDRWPDFLSRRLHAKFGDQFSVLNAGIGGNQVAGPEEYSVSKPFLGGPSSSARLKRDVLDLSGVKALIWLEGINDFSKNGNASAERVIEQYTNGIQTLKRAAIKVWGATVTSALGSTSGAHGFPEQDEKRQKLNEFIRTSPLFDGVIDFDPITLDPSSGGMKAPFIPESTTGGNGDKLHPNRTGYHAMGQGIDLNIFKTLP